MNEMRRFLLISPFVYFYCNRNKRPAWAYNRTGSKSENYFNEGIGANSPVTLKITKSQRNYATSICCRFHCLTNCSSSGSLISGAHCFQGIIHTPHTLTFGSGISPGRSFVSIERFHMTSRRPYWCSKTVKLRPCWCTKTILWEFNSFLI